QARDTKSLCVRCCESATRASARALRSSAGSSSSCGDRREAATAEVTGEERLVLLGRGGPLLIGVNRFRIADVGDRQQDRQRVADKDRKSTRLNSSHVSISYAVFCLKTKINLG